MDTSRWFLGTLLVALWSLTAQAHHNAANRYLLDKVITLNGVVTRFEMVNPHTRLRFDVTTPSGEVQHWVGEGNAPGVLEREGWTATHLVKGQKIKVTGRPSRDGSYEILWMLVEKEDGTKLYGGSNTIFGEASGLPEETKQNFDDIRKRQQEERRKKAQPPADATKEQ